MEIPAEIDSEIDAIIREYPVVRSAAMMVMHLIQERMGYFDDDCVKLVAHKLGIEPVEVYGMLSFYPMFTEEPRGRVHIKVCRTLSCALAGSINLGEEISRIADSPIGATSGAYTIEFVECLGNCTRAPNVQVNDRLYERVKPEDAEKFVDMVRSEAAAGRLDTAGSNWAPQGLDNTESPEFKG